MSRTVRCGGRLARWTRVCRWLPMRHTEVRLIGLAWEWICWYQPRRGYYCSHVVPRYSSGAGEPIELERGWREMKKVRIAEGTAASGPSHVAAIESVMFARFHSVVKHCCVTRYDDGSARKTGWVTIKTQGAMWMATAKDPDACAQITATGQTLDDALALLSQLLGAEEAPWEIDPYMHAQPRRGRRA